MSKELAFDCSRHVEYMLSIIIVAFD